MAPAEMQAYWLAWLQMPRIGPTLIHRLHQHFGDLKTAWLANGKELAQVEGFGPKLIEQVNRARSQHNPQQLLLDYQRINPRFLTPGDGHYPTLLRELHAPPPILNYCGQIDAAEMRGEKPAIAIVGTRHPSEYGRRWTRRLTRALVRRGYTIVSGLAEGIDAEAHRACLEGGGRTVAVLGTGVDVVYPARNRQLYRDILKSGLILSEYGAGTPPDRTHFPQRNRVVAGFCRATIVVEAPKRSGALITANVANEFCRDVYVVPGTLDNPNARGCLELIGQGAEVILDENHLLAMLGDMPSLDVVTDRGGVKVTARTAIETQAVEHQGTVPASSKTASSKTASSKTAAPAIPAALQPVWKAVPVEACSLDRIVQQTQLPTGAVSSALLQLELLGFITELPGKQYQRG